VLELGLLFNLLVLAIVIIAVLSLATGVQRLYLAYRQLKS
jgi:phosphatidylglycerophosphate synthase